MAFEYCISFATYSAANACQTSFPSFCAQLSEVAVLSNSNLSRHPFLKQLETGRWIRSAALHRIQFWTCWFISMSYFNSETNEWSKDWAKQWALLWLTTTSQQFGPFHQNFISHEKNSDPSRPKNYKELKSFWLLNLAKSSSKQVVASSDCNQLGNTLHLLALWPAQRAQPLILQSKPSIIFWNSLQEWLSDDRQGLELGLTLELCSRTNRLPALKSQNNLCGVENLFRSVENAVIKDSCELIPTLIHQTGKKWRDFWLMA